MVLVVGDDPAAQGSLAELLVRAGYGLMQTTNSRDVLRMARQCRPDVILLNLTPGGTSTLDVLRALQADAQARRIPVIVLSAPAWPLLSPEAEGARVIFRKPPKPHRLLAHLAQLVGEAAMPGQTRQGPGPAQQNASAGAPSSPVPASGDRRRRSPGWHRVVAAASWIVAATSRMVAEAAWLSTRLIACWQSAFVGVSMWLVARACQVLAGSIRKCDVPRRCCLISRRLTVHFLLKRRSGALVDVDVPLGLDA